jgi:DNA repair protein RecN (Recombination protein N)
MLRFLRIRQLAVIDTVEVEFGPGFNVLTGETGAGKSMLVGAVGLLLGGRATSDLVRTGEEMATVEAIFERDGDEVLVRREITAQGRSRAFIDGALATATALRDLSSRLVELHGQHEHHTLLDPSTHLGVVDVFGALDSLGAQTQSAFDEMIAARDELARLRAAAHDREARHDLMTYQLGELDRAALVAGEDEELTARRTVLANAEHIERLCAESYASLYEQDDAILAGLGQVWRRVGELAAIDPQFAPYLETRDGIKSQLEDLALFLRRYADGVEASPAALQQVEDRLALLERIKRKYGPSLGEAIARREALRRDLDDLAGGDDRLKELESAFQSARAAYLTVATELSTARQRAAKALCRRLQDVLAELAMEQTRIELRFNAAPMAESEWSGGGVDAAEFFVSPNPGEELRPLARIVSGGELSRIMLAIKTLIATTRRGFSDADDRPPSGSAPGLIFDEVDAGIGGRVADIVGRRLRGLGSAFQVLCITHLPQIAAYADTHFQIEKRVSSGRTKTTVVHLDEAGRIEELSRMLGGTTVTTGLRASAREMLKDRARPERADDLASRRALRLGPDGPRAGQAKAKGERRKSRS